MNVSPGSRVTLHLSLADTEGNSVVSTFDGEPVGFRMGDGTLTPGLELALYGLGVGDRQTLTLSPDQAFGAWDQARVKILPRDQFPPELALHEGLVVSFDIQGGESHAGVVIDVAEHQATVDFNHPLAGREVVFRVEILDIVPPPDAAGEGG